jgi:outer membrane putative beta-barrel porin/alpha-amylase
MVSRIRIILFLLLFAAPASANHGPGTSGGGSSTGSGETLKLGQLELSFREDYTEFEHISRGEAEARAARDGEFDALERAFVTGFSLAYGVTDDFQVGAQIGYYFGDHFIGAESDGRGGAESGVGDPYGLTDLWLNAKYRFLKGAPGNLAAMAGFKFPTGRDDFRLSNGAPLEPSSQPGTGSYDFLVGAAYSRFLTSHMTVDVSAAHTFRTEHDDFRVGDRTDLGLALAYRLTDSIKDFPNFSVFGEALGVILQKDLEGDEHNPNSGGGTMYLSPGVRVRFNPSISLTVAPAFPVIQELNGDQILTRFKLALTLSVSFGGIAP